MVHKDFYRPSEELIPFTVAGRTGWFPVYFHDCTVFSSMHTADYAAVAAALPSDVIRPVGWPVGRALVTVAAFRYGSVRWTSPDGLAGGNPAYGEVAVAAVVTLSADAGRAGLGGFVLLMPVTTEEACLDGRTLFGYPKIVADIDFAEDLSRRSVRVSDEDGTLLTYTVRPGGPILSDRQPRLTYTVLDGQLVQTTSRVHGTMRLRPGSKAARLDLHDHPATQRFRGLGISPAALLGISHLDYRMVIPRPGRPVGPAETFDSPPGPAWRGGRFAVSYPGTGRIDLCSPSAATATGAHH